MKVFKNDGKSKALATMIEDEQSLPYTEVNLEGDVSPSATEESVSSSNSPDGPAPGGVERPKRVERNLTETSRKYDRGNKGFLTETERALRRMDSQNKGFIDQDKVRARSFLSLAAHLCGRWLAVTQKVSTYIQSLLLYLYDLRPT